MRFLWSVLTLVEFSLLSGITFRYVIFMADLSSVLCLIR